MIKKKGRTPLLVFLYSLITFGIYFLYWLVVTKEELNKKGADIPTSWLLIIPFVNWYWLYRFARGFSEKITKDKDYAVWFLLLLFGGWLAAPVFQYEINKR